MAGQILRPPPSALMPIAARAAIRNTSDTSWFGPLEPLKPTAPPGTQPRQFEYLPGQNLLWLPRAQEGIGYGDLIYMADSCDLVRIVIEALKDQITMLPWQVRVKAKPHETEKERAQREKDNPKVEAWTDFLQWPNQDQCWSDWLRMLLEDLFVLDAPSVLMQRTRNGKIGALRVIDGQTITRVIDENGFTPQPPNPAYQQILFGQAAVDLTIDDLVYRPRIQRARKLFGFSPVEQILMTLNIALRRQRFQLANYTEGNVPEALYAMPGSVTEDNVRKFQGWFDQQLAGNLGARRRIWFIPGDDKGINRLHWTKEALLKDEADEWFARVICFAFRMSPKEFIRIMARATAEESQDTAEEVGVRAVCQWIANTLNYIIQRKSGDQDIEFSWAQKREADILKQAQVDAIYVGSGVNTRQEIRERKGDDPSPDPAADRLTVAGPVMALDLAIQQQESQTQVAAHMAANPQAAAGGEPGKAKGQSGEQSPRLAAALYDRDLIRSLEPLTKYDYGSTHAALRIQTADEYISKTDITHLQTTVAGFLKTVGDRLAEKVAARGPAQKADKDDPRQLNLDEVMKLVEEIDWEELVAPVESSLFHASGLGATIGIGQVGVSNVGLISAASDTARDFAHHRAAELVGKRFTKTGKLIENPNAKWRIDATTRDELRALVEKAFNEETRIEDLAEQIRQAGAFSESRSKMIARTEIARAQSLGTLDIWKTMGFVKTVRWDLSADHDEMDLCDANHEAGPIPLGQAFPSGDVCPPQHPNCRCALVAADIA